MARASLITSRLRVPSTVLPPFQLCPPLAIVLCRGFCLNRLANLSLNSALVHENRILTVIPVTDGTSSERRPDWRS